MPHSAGLHHITAIAGDPVRNARATGCHVHTRRVLIVDGEGAREIESPASAGQTCRIPFPPAER